MFRSIIARRTGNYFRHANIQCAKMIQWTHIFLAFRRHAPNGLVCSIDGKISIVKKRNHPTFNRRSLSLLLATPLYASKVKLDEACLPGFASLPLT